MIKIKSSIEKPKELEEDLLDINFSIEKPKELGKNKWLNPPDEFVKKRKNAKHYELETYKLK
jgi:hypothetical protein